LCKNPLRGLIPFAVRSRSAGDAFPPGDYDPTDRKNVLDKRGPMNPLSLLSMFCGHLLTSTV
jgi:hypothetical protein